MCVSLRGIRPDYRHNILIFFLLLFLRYIGESSLGDQDRSIQFNISLTYWPKYWRRPLYCSVCTFGILTVLLQLTYIRILAKTEVFTINSLALALWCVVSYTNTFLPHWRANIDLYQKYWRIESNPYYTEA